MFLRFLVGLVGSGFAAVSRDAPPPAPDQEHP